MDYGCGFSGICIYCIYWCFSIDFFFVWFLLQEKIYLGYIFYEKYVVSLFFLWEILYWGWVKGYIKILKYFVIFIIQLSFKEMMIKKFVI